MSEKMTPSALRADLYRILDRVLDTGEPVDIRRKGKLIRIASVSPPRLSLLEPHPEAVNGDLESLAHMDWSAEWRP